MKGSLWLAALGLAGAVLLAPARAGHAEGPLVLLELFTSQGCYSCPPAEKLLASEFIGRPGVLALEMHVDYWDELIYRGSSWKDPFSQEQFSLRQYRYAQLSRRSPFTPQMVISGAYFTSGTNAAGIKRAISQVGGPEIAAPWRLEFAVEDDVWQVVLRDPLPQGDSEVLTVIYRKKATTAIAGGENKGKLLANHNVVLELVNHGPAIEGRSYPIGATPPGDGCAVILQRPEQGPVTGVWPCAAAHGAS